MKFFVSTGEASGDLHLSYLVKSVKARYKDVDFVGVAGEKSQKEGVEILQDINELAIMGFTEVLKKYKFLKQIYDKGKVKPIDTNLYSKDNTEVQTVLELNKERLVDHHIMLSANAQEYYMAEYWITTKIS